MAPGRANGLYVVVVGGGVRVPFLRGGGNPAVHPPQSRFPLRVNELLECFDVYTLYSLWVGPHLSSHSYPGQPLGSAASKLCGPFPLEPCSISVRGCSLVLGKVLKLIAVVKSWSGGRFPEPRLGVPPASRSRP